MALTFGKTKVNTFGRIFESNPRLLTRNPYLNFLRVFKSKHRHYGLPKLLQMGAKSWFRLTPLQQEMYSQKNVLQRKIRPNIRPPGFLLPAKKFGDPHRPSIPSFTMPNTYRKRSMYTPPAMTKPRNILPDSDSD